MLVGNQALCDRHTELFLVGGPQLALQEAARLGLPRLRLLGREGRAWILLAEARGAYDLLKTFLFKRRKATT